MKLSKQVIIAFSSIVLLGSCGNSNSTKTEEKPNVVATEQRTDVAEGTMELDNGEKWKVNAEMQPFILKGEQIVDEYVAQKKTDYKALAAQLKEQNSQLISSCTMDGKSHEVLHEWLHPHLELVKALSLADNEEKANELVAQIETSYKTFHQYFQ